MKGTEDFELKYSQLDDFSLIGYSDSILDRDRKSIVSWKSHKQLVPTDSTTKAKYVAAAEATKELVWLKKILEDWKEKQVNYTTLLIENTYAILTLDLSSAERDQIT